MSEWIVNHSRQNSAWPLNGCVPGSPDSACMSLGLGRSTSFLLRLERCKLNPRVLIPSAPANHMVEEVCEVYPSGGPFSLGKWACLYVMCHPLRSPQALIVSYMRKYPHLAVEKQRSGSPQMQRRRPPLEEERCFSFVLIRHSQSCWLRGWCRCEITSLIKRPVWYGHTQSWDTPQLSKPPLLCFFFPAAPVWRRRNDSCLKWRCCSFTTLTHLSRWKPISLAFEAADTVAEQHELSAACSFEPREGGAAQ